MRSHHPYAIITIIFWSLAYVLTRLALECFSAPSLGFLRYFVAAVVMAALALKFRIRPPQKSDLVWFLLSGMTGISLYMPAFNKGCETASAAESSVLIATVPVLTAIMAKFIHKENLRPFQYPAIALEFIGVLVLMEAHETFQVNLGHLWLLVAAFLLSAYNILQRRLTKKYPPLTTVVYSILLGEILLFAFAPGALAEAKNAPGIQFLYLAVLGVFSSAVAYFTWAAALARAEKTSSVSNYMFLTPLLAALLGYWLIGEKPSPSTVMGGAIILAGLAVFNFGEAFMGFWKKPPV